MVCWRVYLSIIRFFCPTKDSKSAAINCTQEYYKILRNVVYIHCTGGCYKENTAIAVVFEAIQIKGCWQLLKSLLKSFLSPRDEYWVHYDCTTSCACIVAHLKSVYVLACHEKWDIALVMNGIHLIYTLSTIHPEYVVRYVQMHGFSCAHNSMNHRIPWFTLLCVLSEPRPKSI